MLTPLGKELRKLRIERAEIIRDMATRLNMSPSYLSSIEAGKRTIPSDLVDTIVSLYQLPHDHAWKLRSAYEESVEQAKIDLSNVDSDHRHLALSFARNFGNLAADDFSRIKEILQERDKDNGYG